MLDEAGTVLDVCLVAAGVSISSGKTPHSVTTAGGELYILNVSNKAFLFYFGAYRAQTWQSMLRSSSRGGVTGPATSTDSFKVQHPQLVALPAEPGDSALRHLALHRVKIRHLRRVELTTTHPMQSTPIPHACMDRKRAQQD